VAAKQKNRLSLNMTKITGADASDHANVQRQVMIGTDNNSHEITTGEIVDLVYQPFAGMEETAVDRTRTETPPAERSRYTIHRNRQRALTIVNDMCHSSEEFYFQNLDAMRAEVARRIEAGQGSLPRELTIPDARDWLDDNNISYTETSRSAVHFDNAITVDFSQAAPGFNLLDGRGRVSNSHPVTPQLAVALVRLIRHLNDQGVTALHHSGVSVGTHLLLGYAIDIRGFTFNDGTEILLPPAWNDTTTTVPSGETAQVYMRRIAMWMAGNVFGQVLGPGYPNHDNHFHCQVPYGRTYRGLVTGAP
jgi:hypothetical protein